MSAKSLAPIMQLKVTLKHIKPPIWRRLEVSADNTLGDLHYVVQAAMGWDSSHLHAFRDGRTYYGPPEVDSAGVDDEDSVTLGRVFEKERKKLLYKYDFGDCWEHDVLFEKLVPRDPEVRYPRCVAGKRACPPEDCGSYPGYSSLCALLADPKLPDPNGFRKWIGRSYDPECFDIDGANRRLSGH